MRALLTFLIALVLTVSAFAQSGGITDEKKEKAELARIEKLQQAAKAKYLKKPKDAKLKKDYINLTLVLANNTQASVALTSKEKYPKALRLYREILKIDPKNKEALENKNRIEMIYKSLGRPVPK
jgi:tetratricopeptide (TPR) repeat protein